MTPEIKQRIEQIRRGEVPEGYKRVKIGVVPQSWQEERFETISKIYSGGTPETANEKFWNGEIYWCTPTDITESSKFISKTRKKISQLGFENSSVQMLPVGSILMCSRATIGPRCINTVPMTTNQGFKSLVCNSEIANTLYIFDLIDLCIKDFIKLSSGSTFLELSKTDLAKYKVPLPPISEQQKIAEILTAQDNVIELKEKLLNEKQLQKKYLMQQLLTGKKRLPGFSGNWKTVKVNDVLLERKEKNIHQDLRICSVAVQKGVVDQIEHLGRSYAANNTSNYSVAYYGDIIYTKSPTGDFPYGIIKQSLLQEKVAISPLYGVFIPATFSLGYFLHTYFQSSINAKNYLLPIIQKGAKNTINITNDTFLSNKLYLPLDEKEQSAIANIFITADREIELLQKDIDQEKQKKKALMQLLLTGIVRV